MTPITHVTVSCRVTGETYVADSPESCRDWADMIGYRFVVAYGKSVVIGFWSYEPAEADPGPAAAQRPRDPIAMTAAFVRCAA